MTNQLYVWQMIKEAVENLGGKVTYSQIREYIKNKYREVNEKTINSRIIACSVNHPSRVYYTENNKTRAANSKYDFLFLIQRGEVEVYDPEKHGTWEICQNEYGRLAVAQTGLEEFPETEDESPGEEQVLLFPVESNLRDFIAKNIETIRVNGSTLKVYTDENGRNGVEYPTAVGPIDILAVDENNNFVIFELKLSRGVDKTVGQLLRYMGWVREKLAKDGKVNGIIVAKTIDEKLKYAASIVPDISLFEYELNFNIQQVGIPEERSRER